MTQLQSDGESRGEPTETVFRTAKKRAKEIQESCSLIEKSIDYLHQEILDCQRHTKALQQEITHLSGLKHELKGKFVLPPF